MSYEIYSWGTVISSVPQCLHRATSTTTEYREELRHNTAITEENAKLDLKANGVWGDKFHTTFFDVHVFNPHAPSYRSTAPTRLYQRHEKEKRRAYNQRITEVEHASFSPLIFFATGGIGHIATTVYQRLGALIAQKKSKTTTKLYYG